jgi:hypothetical protein
MVLRRPSEPARLTGQVETVSQSIPEPVRTVRAYSFNLQLAALLTLLLIHLMTIYAEFQTLRDLAFSISQSRRRQSLFHLPSPTSTNAAQK